MLDGFQKTVSNTGEILKALGKSCCKIVVLFGTRPEAIKLAPVILELKKQKFFQTVVVSSSQHTDLLAPFLEIFKLKVDYDLRLMTANQTPNAVQPFHGGLSDETGIDSDGINTSFIGGDGKFSA